MKNIDQWRFFLRHYIKTESNRKISSFFLKIHRQNRHNREKWCSMWCRKFDLRERTNDWDLWFRCTSSTLPNCFLRFRLDFHWSKTKRNDFVFVLFVVKRRFSRETKFDRNVDVSFAAKRFEQEKMFERVFFPNSFAKFRSEILRSLLDNSFVDQNLSKENRSTKIFLENLWSTFSFPIVLFYSDEDFRWKWHWHWDRSIVQSNSQSNELNDEESTLFLIFSFFFRQLSKWKEKRKR